MPKCRLIDALIAFAQRENVCVLGGRTDVIVGMLVRARTLAGRPIPDALIVAAAMGVDAVALATFDRGQARYGFPVVVPSAAARPWAARSQRVGASGPCSPIQSGTGR